VSGPYELLSEELVAPSAVRLAGGDIFIYGGLYTRGSLDFRRAARRYSPSDGSFRMIDGGSDVLQSPSQTFSFVTAAGNVFVIDDQSGTDVTGRRYDFAADAWTELPTLAVANGALDAAVQLASGDVLVIQNKGAQRIDPDAGEWRETGARPGYSVRGAAALLADGRLLSVSGSSDPASVYDPDTNAWTRVASPRVARRSPALIGLPDGRALLVGGVLDAEELRNRATVLETELYDPEADAWSDGPALEAAQTSPLLTLLDDDVVAWGGLSFPCASAAPCGGRAVTRLNLADSSVSALPDMSAPGTPHVFEIEPEDYLVVMSVLYQRYSLQTGPRKP
jgi:hypothetical protein